jgi:hypothetical protein
MNAFLRRVRRQHALPGEWLDFTTRYQVTFGL